MRDDDGDELAEVATLPRIENMMIRSGQASVNLAARVDSDDGQDAALMRRLGQLVQLERKMPKLAPVACLIGEVIFHPLYHLGRGWRQCPCGRQSFSVVNSKRQRA